MAVGPGGTETPSTKYVKEINSGSTELMQMSFKIITVRKNMYCTKSAIS